MKKIKTLNELTVERYGHIYNGKKTKFEDLCPARQSTIRTIQKIEG
jgi:hypothetical protein